MRMPTAVDVDDSGSDVAEVVDITLDSEDEVAAVPCSGIGSTASPPLCFQGYRRGRELGQGGSGQVFVCKKAGCKAGFAVKAVSLRRLQMSPDVESDWKKLCREVEIWRKLPPHPNIVQLVDSFKESSWFMLVMELVGGGDLFTVLVSRPTPRLTDPEAAFVARQLGSAISFLHGQEVVHRDVKLENVLVCSQQRRELTGSVLYTVKLTDFGLSRFVGPNASEATSTVGTHPYTAPEVLAVEGSHSFSSDLWCFGVLLHVLLTGHFPFDKMPTEQAAVDQIMDRALVGKRAKEVLQGFLRIQSSQRMSLSVMLEHEWSQDSEQDISGKPHKRHRTSSQNGKVIVPGIDSVEVIPSPPRNACLSECAASGDTRHGTASVEIVPAHLSRAGDVTSSRQEPSATMDLVELDISQPSPCASPATYAGAASPEDGPGVWTPFPEAPLSPLVFDGSASPLVGTWTPFAEEMSLQLSEVRPPNSFSPSDLQVHVFVPDHLAGFILGKSGARIQETAAESGCKVWMTSRDGTRDRRVVIIGSYKQCKVAQQLVHEQLARALRKDWQDTEADVVLLVRAEAAGVVTGKQGFVLNQIRKQSGAKIKLHREEVENLRPCMISGTLPSILRAEKHIFELIQAVAPHPSKGAAAADGATDSSTVEQPQATLLLL